MSDALCQKETLWKNDTKILDYGKSGNKNENVFLTLLNFTSMTVSKGV